MGTVAYLNTQQLGDFIVEVLRKRLRINLELGCLDDIVLKTTRVELRENTNTSRIEDATIERMLNRVVDEGFHVAGRPGGSTFVFTVRVREILTQFDSIGDLEWWNDRHKDLIRPGQSEVED